jgi:choline dehydrogenase
MHDTEFDYVIVGAGSSGSVVASRPSEDSACTVCAIEAGPADPGLWGGVPLGFPRVLGNPRFMWPFQTEPEPGLNGRSVSAARGKVPGGSSAVNGMVYVRGSPLDYSLWRQLGAKGWSYDDVLPYFRKAERRIDPDSAGPLGVTRANWRNPLADAFIAAGHSIGLPVNHGFHGPDISASAIMTSASGKDAVPPRPRPISNRREVARICTLRPTRRSAGSNFPRRRPKR